MPGECTAGLQVDAGQTARFRKIATIETKILSDRFRCKADGSVNRPKGSNGSLWAVYESDGI